MTTVIALVIAVLAAGVALAVRRERVVAAVAIVAFVVAPAIALAVAGDSIGGDAFTLAAIALVWLLGLAALIGFRKRSPLPGFSLGMGITFAYLGLMVVIPLATVVIRSSTLTASDFWATISSDRALASYGLSIGASLLAAAINVVFGTLVAWVLVRYEFPGRRIVDALVDLPFALPTAVAGIALTATWSEHGFFIRIDQYSFVRRGVPAVFPFMGMRSDSGIDAAVRFKEWLATRYHLPQDDSDQPMDLEAGARNAQLEFLLGLEIANADERPTWKRGDFFGSTFGRQPAGSR
jgi:hypothetical protein